jgi:purine-binding chemotaxis protein CheW
VSLHVLFGIGDAEYVLPADEVLHVETYAGATHVPGAPPHVAGVMQIRRRVVPIVDLRVRFGLARIEPTLDSRVVVVREDERTVGLLVDRAREVVELSKEQFQPPPELVARESRGFVRAVARAGERLVMLIDCEKVIGEERLHGPR